MKKKSIKLIVLSMLVLLLAVSGFGLGACIADDNNEELYVGAGKGISYTIDVSIDADDKTANIKSLVEYTYKGGKTNIITLSMNSNVFVDTMPVENSSLAAAYPKGKSYGKVEVAGVTINGGQCRSELSGAALILTSDKTIKNNAKLSIMADYKLALPNNTLRYGYSNSNIQLSQFYPQVARAEEYSIIGDSFYSQVADYSVKISYPSTNKMLASGECVANLSSDNIRTDSYAAKSIRDFCIVVGLSGNIATMTKAGLTVNYLYNTDTEYEKNILQVIDAIEVFSREFGEYGKKVFNMVEMPFMHGGMEYGDFIIVANQIKNPQDKRTVIIHEIAHQWWYGKVGSDQTNHSWQDEGLTEFSVYLYYLKSNKLEEASKFLWETEYRAKKYRERVASLEIPLDENIDRKLDDFLSADEYFYCVYSKGSLMFASIYELMGDKLFMSATKDYLKLYNNKIAQPEDMFKVFNNHHVGISQIMMAWLGGVVVNAG